MGGDMTKLFVDKQLVKVKLSVLDEMEASLQSELKELRAKDKALAKRFGKFAHNI